MRKVFAVFLSVVFCFSLWACDIGLESDTNIQNPTHESHDSSATTHTHSWASATCTTPKTCTTCGKTEGSAKEHSWKDATCTSPKTCNTCGKAEGSVREHSWKDATCTTPKTCTACGKTTGSISNHTYSNGKCTVCGTQDPSNTQEPMVWIPTNGGKKYHSKSSCSGMKNPRQVTISEAERQGFTPCSRCY